MVWVMNQELRVRLIRSDWYRLWLQSVQGDALVQFLAVNHRFAALQNQQVVVLDLAIREGIPSAIIKNIAILQDFNERGTFVLSGLIEGLTQMLRIEVNASGHEGRVGRQDYCQRVEGVIQRTDWSAFGDVAFQRGGRILPFGQSVDLVVE